MDIITPEQAEAYDRWYATSPGLWADRLEKKAVFELLPSVNGLRFIDAGCGTGNITKVLATQGAVAVGLDPSAAMLSRAKLKTPEGHKAMAWVQGDLLQLPFRANSFAGAVSILALDFIPSREAALLELARVLRPGGVLVIGVLNRFSLWTLKRQVRGWFRTSPWREINFLGARDLMGLLQQTKLFHQFQWRRAVYWPPLNFPGLERLIPYWERLGAVLYPGAAAFLALSAKKRPG